MADYIERDAAQECIHKWLSDIFGIDKLELTVLNKRLNAIPAADVEPVVRCGECKHFQQFRPHDGFCKISGMLWSDDFFCADGARMDGDEDV